MNIVIAYMPPVFTKMRGNSVCASLLSQQSRINRIGMNTAACITYGRNMIDIDAKP